jgi:transposase InsO family protein
VRGRYPSGPEVVERLGGSDEAKRRLRVLLEVVPGRCRVKDACARLGLKEARLEQLRRRALPGALAALEPRPGGRPRRRAEVTADQVEELTARLRELELALRVAQARAEVAEIRGAAPTTRRPARRRAPKSNAPPANDEPPPRAGAAAAVADDRQRGAAAVVGAGTAAPRAATAPRRPRGHRGARGWARQRPRRQAEAAARDRVVTAAAWAQARGWQRPAVAARLTVSARSLRRWARGPARLSARGRPVVRPAVAVRQAVLAKLAEWGPRVGVARLRAAFPTVSRAELADLRDRYRRVAQDKQRGRLARLTWTRPGAVWAADFAWPPAAIEGRYPRLLSVRDLASGVQLAWRPAAGETAAAACSVLADLFREHGAPLVLKVDNGAAFDSAELRKVLSQHGVEGLYSPPYTPQYNGAAEAGVGARKGADGGAGAGPRRPGRLDVGRYRGGASGGERGVRGAAGNVADAGGSVGGAGAAGRGSAGGVPGGSAPPAAREVAGNRGRGVRRRRVGQGVSVACGVAPGARGARLSCVLLEANSPTS